MSQKHDSVLNSEQIPNSENDELPIMKNQRSYIMYQSSLKSDSTKKSYDRCLGIFLKYSHIKDFDSLLKLTPEDTQRMIEDYALSHNSSRGSLKVMLHALKAFYSMNDVILNWHKLFRMLPEQKKTRGDIPYTTEQLRTVLSTFKNPKWRAIIHFIASSGVRVGFVEELKMKHLERIGDNCRSVVVYADTKDEYITFIHQEAVKALDEYFETRKKNGEILTPESWVFVGLEMSNKPMTARRISTQMCRNVRMFLERGEMVDGRYRTSVVHGIRKRFNTIMKDNDSINKSHIEKMLGHSQSSIKLDSVYHKPTTERMFVEYQKAIPQLVIDDSYRLEISLKQSEDELKRLQDDKDRKIQSLENQMFEIQKNLAEFVKRKDL